MLDAATLAWVGVVAFFAATIGGLGGFGTSVILTAVLIPIVGVKAVVPLLTVAGVIINGGRMFFNRDAIDWPTCRTVLLAAMPATFVGVMVFAMLPARTLQIVLAVFVAAVVPLRRWAAKRQWRLGKAGVAAGGGVFGFLSGFVSGTGVLLISVLLSTGLPGAAIIATDAAISLINDAFRVAVFGGHSLLDTGTLLSGVIIGLMTIPGSAFARWLTQRMSARLHIAFIEALLLVAAVWLIVSAIRAE